MTSVLCLIEHGTEGVSEASRRALSVARALAESAGETLVACAIGPFGAVELDELGRYGVEVGYVIGGEGLDPYAPAAWARALLQLAAETASPAIVAAGSDRGNEVLAHAGAMTGLAMMANCFNASRGGEGIRVSRQRWAGSLIEDSFFNPSTALLTVAFDGVVAEPSPLPTVVVERNFRPELEASDTVVRVMEWTKRPGGIGLAEARVVVGGGRGVASEENFGALDELAGLLGGAVGVSRAVTSLGWRPHSQQVGQTGTRIAPDLYLATGISGATQHLAGCQSAKVIVAINTDVDAPIFARADYAVIGDLNEVVPALCAAIRAR